MRSTWDSSTKDLDHTSEFKSKIDVKQGRYFTDVFEYFVKWHDNLKQDKLEKEIVYLKGLVEQILGRNDPITIKVTINSRNNGASNYNISSYAHFYGDLLRAAQLLIPEKLLVHKRHILNFIPFAFSDDQQTILEIIPEISDSDIEEVNKLYLNKKNDARYLIPNSYIYMTKSYKEKCPSITSPKAVLEDFILDNDITSYDRKSALEALLAYLNKTDAQDLAFLKGIEGICDKNPSELKEVYEESLAAQAKIFKVESAINWFFEELKKRAFITQHKTHGVVVESVTPEKEELRSFSLADPLINLQDPQYYPKFIDLIEFSIKKLNENYEGYFEYTNYLQKIFIKYLENLDDYSQIKKLEIWVKQHEQDSTMNWFSKEIQLLEDRYVNNKGRKNLDDVASFLEDMG